MHRSGNGEGKIAVVTGGAGFIGSHACDLLLDKGYEVRVIDDLSNGRLENLKQHKNNASLTVEIADIRTIDQGSSVMADANVIFHFAGIGDIVPSIERPLEYMETNVIGTARVMEQARKHGVGKVVYAASSSCYGLADTPTDESHRIDPQYPYALSKYIGEQTAFHWSKLYGIPTTSVRIFNAYGVRTRTTGAYGAVFGVFLKQKLAGTPFTVVGDGSQARDFVYVTDVAEAFFLAAERGRSGESYNLGCGDPKRVNELVSLLGGEVVYIPKRPGEPDVTHADISKIRKELGWQAKISFKEGVEKMVSRIDDWKDAPLWDKNSIADATRDWFTHLS